MYTYPLSSELNPYLKELCTQLNSASTIGLTTPDLDGDSVGALGALYHLLSDLPHQPQVRIYTSGLPHSALDRLIQGIPQDHWLTDRDLMDQEPLPTDVSIVVDGGAHRLSFFKSWFYKASVNVQIDHHHSANLQGIDIPFVDRTASSTTELIFPLVHALKRPLTFEIAQCIFAGLIFDTSIFRYKLTRPQALRVAADLLETGIDHALIVEEVLLQKSSNYVQFKARALQKLELSHHQKISWICLTQEEMQGQSPAGLIDEITFIEGVEMSILIVEKAHERIKVSLRSRGKLDVSLFASRLNPQGGGHQRAAGASLSLDLPQAISYVKDQLALFLKEFAL